MAQGTQKVLGGTTYKRYPDPNVSNLPNQFGLYQWSAYSAYYAQIDEETGVVSASSNPAAPALLFLSDFPALLRVGGFNGSSFTYTVAKSTLTSGLKTVAGGSTGVTLDAYGQVAAGYTKLGGVFCTGFPITAYAFPETTPPSQFFLEVVANSPVICSPIGSPTALVFGFGGTPVGKGVSPIILRDIDYTQAIRDNDNVIVSTDGIEDVAFVVVGLWHAPSKG